ncbi:hypothetical protein SAMN05444365_10511 [Micromonospora pattaloongensis]|uniref:WD40-like Beta Propeller Repeat n=1 Tax=Micromonospora pattaloongensis TaxID=405436 RepID=A0A1H3PTL6_9ACTN|nr:hypothetical protein [Micromonospora pattaloongensis]SDZ04288.1 hypothetical protein SAMN05444365_10511 [Micromonospora pattaloongensis]
MNAISSRTIARRTLLATAAFTAGSVVLLTAACGTDQAVPGLQTPSPVVAGSQTPSPVPAVSSPPPPAATSPSRALPVAGSIAGLPGWLYYADFDRLVRLTRSGVKTVLTTGAHEANVSPDGASIAFVNDSGNVVITDRDGQHPRTVLRDSITLGYEPAWSPDSQRLLVAKSLGPGDTTVGILTIASSNFTPLAHQPQGIHLLWSADGQHLAYSTGNCRIVTADADGGNARTVPGFGDPNSTANPQQRRSCDPYSISPDGSLIAVNQRTGSQPNGDIGRDLFANTIIDTRTGRNITLPVTGSITAILFQPNGDTLVRTKNGTTNQLTLLNPDRTIKAQVTEPATVKNTRLLGYTPN